MPYISTYSGTKAYIHQFTNSLKSELLAMGMSGIEVLALIIGNVESATNKHKASNNSTSRDCAVSSLDRVGCRRYLTFTDLTIAFQVSALQLMPTAVVQWVLSGEMEKRRQAELRDQ